MKFISTRGDAPELGFRDAMLTALARDGGLYVPASWPQLDLNLIRSMQGRSYADIARIVLAPFVEGELDDRAFSAMIDDAYANFRHPAVTPLVQTGSNEWIVELFHGPTMAFKDVAMQLLSRMMDHVLVERNERATIVGATSGDTGGAAIEAFRGRENVDIFILFPQGKVSAVQQRQMTTVKDKNVHALAVRGNFDDCQALLKAMFNNHPFRDALSLSGVNSINWGRVMAQIVYYFAAATALGAPDRKVSFTVPTGNFGDIFAGYAAKKMGLPVDQLVIATNTNDILARALKSGRYEVGGVTATASPSMDIQVSSNFERLLFEALDRQGSEVKRCMAGLSQSGAFTIPDQALKNIQSEFSAGSCNEDQCHHTIENTWEKAGYLLDPHTAVGLHVAREHTDDASPMITLATAHPAKFPASVAKACGHTPELPGWQGDLMDRQERFAVIDNDIKAVEHHIEARSRAGKRTMNISSKGAT